MSAYHKARYRADSEWRRLVIERSREYQQRNANDPEFRRLRYLDKTIYQLRERMEDHQQKATAYERRLLAAVEEREEIRARRRRVAA